MKKLITLLLIFLVFNSCDNKRFDVKHIRRNYFKNNTTHSIKLLPYKNGLVITDSIKIFTANSTTLLESRTDYMPWNDISFDFVYRKVADSVIVTFDGIKKEKHDFFIKNGNETIYLPNKERCIINNDGGRTYKTKIIEQRKKFVEVEFTYTFTEQDFLDAEFF